jgi:hypothetical protein
MSKQSFEINAIGGDVVPNGTSLVGQIRADLDELLACFKYDMGASDDGKVRVEFWVEFHDLEDDDYVVATIYDWKSNTPIEDQLVWHVGGKDSRALIFVQDVLHKHRFPKS